MVAPRSGEGVTVFAEVKCSTYSDDWVSRECEERRESSFDVILVVIVVLLAVAFVTWHLLLRGMEEDRSRRMLERPREPSGTRRERGPGCSSIR